MANPEDIELFLKGVEEWNKGVENREVEWNTDLSKCFRIDLSGAQIRNILQQRVIQEENFFMEQATHYPRVDFSFCDLRHANFSMLDLVGYVGFDFREANFMGANLQEAKFTGADLTGAYFIGTHLENTVLQGATLDDARLGKANLTGTDLTATRPWRANLFKPNPLVPSLGEPKSTSVSCVADLIEICWALHGDSDNNRDSFRLYYRGEPRRWKLRPSVMRQRSYRKEEGRMLLDMMTRRPEDFSRMTTTLSQWVLAQHHGLKTRLLDVTKNPLVALFYACDGDFVEEEGRLHVFAVPHELVRPYDSDSISIITNFAKLSHSEQSLLLGKRRGIERHTRKYADVMGKLYHLIGQEKPHFQRRIDPRDLFRVFVVEPQQSFERIRAQSGAFLISAFHERFESNQILRWNKSIPTYRHYTLTIPHECKCRILKELSLLNITHETLFPGLDETARAIKDEYASLLSSRNNTENTQDNKTWRDNRDFMDFERPELPPSERFSL